MKRILVVSAIILLIFSTNSFAQRATVLSAIDTNLPSSSKLTAAQLRTALKAIANSVYDGLDGTVKTADLEDPTPLIYSTMSAIQTTSVTDNYTLILTDVGKFISMTAATDKTITIPLFATVAYPVNTVIYFENLGTADLIIAITATGVLTSESSWVKIPAKGCAFIRKSATNTWNLAGRLKA